MRPKRKMSAKERDRERRRRRKGHLPPWLAASVLPAERRHGQGRRGKD